MNPTTLIKLKPERLANAIFKNSNGIIFNTSFIFVKNALHVKNLITKEHSIDQIFLARFGEEHYFFETDKIKITYKKYNKAPIFGEKIEQHVVLFVEQTEKIELDELLRISTIIITDLKQNEIKKLLTA